MLSFIISGIKCKDFCNKSYFDSIICNTYKSAFNLTRGINRTLYEFWETLYNEKSDKFSANSYSIESKLNDNRFT